MNVLDSHEVVNIGRHKFGLACKGCGAIASGGVRRTVARATAHKCPPPPKRMPWGVLACSGFGALALLVLAAFSS